jgi:hypothetical protein
MNTITKIRILESGLMEVDPLTAVDFGHNKLTYQWSAGGIFPTDKKGEITNKTTIVPSQLSDYEQEQLMEALKTKLQYLKSDYFQKAKTAEKILEAVNDKDRDY